MWLTDRQNLLAERLAYGQVDKLRNRQIGRQTGWLGWVANFDYWANECLRQQFIIYLLLPFIIFPICPLSVTFYGHVAPLVPYKFSRRCNTNIYIYIFFFEFHLCQQDTRRLNEQFTVFIVCHGNCSRSFFGQLNLCDSYSFGTELETDSGSVKAVVHVHVLSCRSGLSDHLLPAEHSRQPLLWFAQSDIKLLTDKQWFVTGNKDLQE